MRVQSKSDVHSGLDSSTHAITSVASSSSIVNGSNVEAAFNGDYVKTVAESNGISNLSDACASAIGTSATYIIKDMIQQAAKFTFHGRRKRMNAGDIDRALSIKALQPLFGFTCKDGYPFRYAGSSGRDLFVNDEREIELAQVVNLTAPKLPLEISTKAHWLAIDGKQPAIPENPPPSFEDVPSTSFSTNHAKNDTGLANISQVGRMMSRTEEVQVRTTTTHALSVELQIYFKEITEAIMGNDDAKRTEALHSLQTDTGLQQILPRLCGLIVEGVRINIAQHNLALLIYSMRMVQSLIMNSALSLDHQLHLILPSIFSCVLSKNLCSRPDVDNHWALREFSGRLVAILCKICNVAELRHRVTTILTSVLGREDASFNSIYGSLFTLNELGMETVKSIILPNLSKLNKEIERSRDRSSTLERMAVDRVECLIVKFLVQYVRNHKPPAFKEINDFRKAFDGFSDLIYNAVTADSTSNNDKSSSNNFATPSIKYPAERRYNPPVGIQSNVGIMNQQPVYRTSLNNVSLKHSTSSRFVARATPPSFRNSSHSTYVDANSSPAYSIPPVKKLFIPASQRASNTESFRH